MTKMMYVCRSCGTGVDPSEIVEGRHVCVACQEHKCETCGNVRAGDQSSCPSCVELAPGKEMKLQQVPDIKKDRLVNEYVGGVLEYNTTASDADSFRRETRQAEWRRQQDALEGTFRGSPVDYCPTCFMSLPATGECSNCE